MQTLLNKASKWINKKFNKRYQERDIEVKKRGIIIYNVYDNFSFRQYFIKTAESKIFEWLMTIIIIANTICCTISAEYQVKHNGEDLDILNILEIFFVTAYTVEFFIKIVAHPAKYWANAWNIFDFLILIVSYLPYIANLANLSFLRVIRAIRLLRLIRSFEELSVLLESLGKTFQSSLVLIIMLCIFILIIAITALYLFGEGVPDTWGTLGSSILNTFAFSTADAWGAYQDDLDAVYGEVSRIFSVLVILFLGIIFSQGLVVASVTDGFSESAEAQRKRKSNELKKQNKKYSNKVKDEEIEMKKLKFVKAKEDAFFLCDLSDDDEIESHLNDKGNVDPQKNMFENPQWMNALKLILAELQKDNRKKKLLYNDIFKRVLQMSDFTNSINRKIGLNDQQQT